VGQYVVQLAADRAGDVASIRALIEEALTAAGLRLRQELTTTDGYRIDVLADAAAGDEAIEMALAAVRRQPVPPLEWKVTGLTLP